MIIEKHGDAWHRCYFIKKEMGWPIEANCPIRLRGYSELIMRRISGRVRKKIDSALKRGYALDQKADFKRLLTFICDYNPIQPITIGYVGKTNFNVWVKTAEDAIDLKKELRAQTVMTEAVNQRLIDRAATPSDHGYYEVYVRQWIEAGGKGSSDQPQLKSQFSELRVAIDEWMEEDAPIRERIARWCDDDNSTIRIPFDTHQEE